MTTPTNTPVHVILDTDIGSDCDDAGALAVLHALADRGEVEILACMLRSEKNAFGPAASRLSINTTGGARFHRSREG